MNDDQSAANDQHVVTANADDGANAGATDTAVLEADVESSARAHDADDNDDNVEQPETLRQPLTAAAQPAQQCFSTADRYGVVFTTLLENKVLAIKREQQEAAAASGCSPRRLKPKPTDGTGPTTRRRGLAKVLTSCVRRNSLPPATRTTGAQTTGQPAADTVDIELGHIRSDAEPTHIAPTQTAALHKDCQTSFTTLTRISDDVTPAPQRRHTTTSSSPPCALSSPQPQCVQTPIADDGAVATTASAASFTASPATQPNRGQLSAAQQHRQRILAARSISAQASPVLPRTHTAAAAAAATAATATGGTVVVPTPSVATAAASLPTSIELRLGVPASAQPPATPIRCTSATAETGSGDRFADTLARSLAVVKAQRERFGGARAATVDCSTAGRRSAQPPSSTTAASVGFVADSASSSHGFINSFNELTAHGLRSGMLGSRAVLAEQQQPAERYRAGWPSRPSSFDQRMPLERTWNGTGAAEGEQTVRSSRRSSKQRSQERDDESGGGASERSERGTRRKYRK